MPRRFLNFELALPCHDIFYFKDLVFLEFCVKISMKRMKGGPFSFDRKRMNKDLVL